MIFSRSIKLSPCSPSIIECFASESFTFAFQDVPVRDQLEPIQHLPWSLHTIQNDDEHHVHNGGGDEMYLSVDLLLLLFRITGCGLLPWMNPDLPALKHSVLYDFNDTLL